jgi:hypothetical protein
LTTVTPVAAATMAAIVEMLTALVRSPPVPATATGRPRDRDFRGVPVESVHQSTDL